MGLHLAATRWPWRQRQRYLMLLQTKGFLADVRDRSTYLDTARRAKESLSGSYRQLRGRVMRGIKLSAGITSVWLSAVRDQYVSDGAGR